MWLCARVVIIYKGRSMANEEILSHLVEQRDLESIARDIGSAIRR